MPAELTASMHLAARVARPTRAVLTDVDGTLYRQSPVRRRMVFELLGATLRSPRCGWRTARAIRAYRKSQEHLRAEGFHGDVRAEQIRRACLGSGLPAAFVTDCVEEWMEQRPLASLRGAMFADIPGFFEWCRENEIRLAAVSDYDPRRKLEALGLAHHFDTVICAQDPAVGCFKPDPRSLQAALEKLRIKPDEALYVGDREDVDVAAARRGGIPAALLSPRGGRARDGCIHIRSFSDLRAIIEAAMPYATLAAAREETVQRG